MALGTSENHLVAMPAVVGVEAVVAAAEARMEKVPGSHRLGAQGHQVILGMETVPLARLDHLQGGQLQGQPIST